MRAIPFAKYTHCGNNFLIVDELDQIHLDEHEKPFFAYRSSNVNFGIGADGLLVIQPFNAKIIKAINSQNNYWNTLPLKVGNCSYIFRLFEQNMKEALACGNGFLCIASHLHERFGLNKLRIMTEVPLSQPNVIDIGFNLETMTSWCNLGFPRRAPEAVVPNSIFEHYKENIDAVYGLKIGFRSHDLHSFIEDTPLLFSGYLTFTGEPHLVIFPDECIPPELSNTIFPILEPNQPEKRRNFGSWLVNHIGSYINKHYQDLFPIGVNVNFARVLDRSGTVQYRCYERGVDRETLACGTGAVAVVYIIKALHLLPDSKVVTMIPYLCNFYEPDSKLLVVEEENGLLLCGKPMLLCTGSFMYNGINNMTNQ
jgi:diaminopimelate epimerase